MHAMQMRTSDFLSVAMPPKVFIPARSSSTADSFRMKWQEEMSPMEGYKSVEPPVTTKAGFVRTPLNDQSPIRTPDAKVSVDEPEEIAGRVCLSSGDRVVVASAVPNAAASKDGLPDGRGTTPATKSTATLDRPARITKAKGDAEEPERSHLSEAEKTQGPFTSSNTFAPSDAPRGSVPAPAHLSHFATTPPPVGNSQANQGTSRTTRPGQPSMAEPIGKVGLAKPAPASNRVGEPEESVKQSASAPAPAASGSPSTTLEASSIASGAHSNAAGVLSVLSPALAPGHSSQASAQVDEQLQPGKFANSAGFAGTQLVASGPAQLEVGVFDGTHGWLRIRAEIGSGGAVNASLTASAFAHDSLKAVLPEMANYLGSEAVSVTRLAVHRLMEGTSAEALGSQQSGDAPGYRPKGEQSQQDAESQKSDASSTHHPEAVSEPVIATTVSGSGPANAVGSDDWIRGISRSMPSSLFSLGVLGGVSGSWLSVCA